MRSSSYYAGSKSGVKKVDLSAASITGCTPLHDAVASGHFEVVKLLITYGGKLFLSCLNCAMEVFKLTRSVLVLCIL
jgi:ankyrin repeat protein